MWCKKAALHIFGQFYRKNFVFGEQTNIKVISTVIPGLGFPVSLLMPSELKQKLLTFLPVKDKWGREGRGWKWGRRRRRNMNRAVEWVQKGKWREKENKRRVCWQRPQFTLLCTLWSKMFTDRFSIVHQNFTFYLLFYNPNIHQFPLSFFFHMHLLPLFPPFFS